MHVLWQRAENSTRGVWDRLLAWKAMDATYEVPKAPNYIKFAKTYLPRSLCEFTKQFWDIRLADAVQGPPGLEPQSQGNKRAERDGKGNNLPVSSVSVSMMRCFVHSATRAVADSGHTLPGAEHTASVDEGTHASHTAVVSDSSVHILHYMVSCWQVNPLTHCVCTPTALPGFTLRGAHPYPPAQNGNESGTVDEPSNEPQGLQEPETEDIKTVSAGNTIYSSATSFEDLHLSPELLQVEHPCQAHIWSPLGQIMLCQSLSP